MAREVQGWIEPETTLKNKNGKTVRGKDGKCRPAPGTRWFARHTYTDSQGDRKYVRKVLPTEAAAKKELRRMLNDYDGRGESGVKGERMTFNQLAAEYAKAKLVPVHYIKGKKVRGRRSLDSAQGWLKVLQAYFGSKKVRAIRHSEIEQFKNDRQNTPTRLGGERQIASVNRELELLRAVLRFAVKNDYIAKSPFAMGDLISKADETQRDRVLSHDEERRLLEATGARVVTYRRKAHRRRGSKVKIAAREITVIDTGARREHLRAMIIAALDTAARFGEMRAMTWGDVDFDNREIRLRATTTKTKTARSIGMTQRLHDELQRLWQQSPRKLSGQVFGIASVKTSFRAALAVAKIKDFRWHDFRHTSITRMVAAGLPTAEIMRRSGHTQMKTFMRYVNPSAERARHAAEQLEAYNNANASASLAQVTELVQ